MAVPSFDFVFDAILGVLGIVLFVGIALTVLLVVLRRRQRDQRAESLGLHTEPPSFDTEPPGLESNASTPPPPPPSN